MDNMQLRFLTTQALYGKDLQERNGAIRQLQQGNLTAADIAAISVRLELALSCQDEYVRSSAAMLLAGLADQIPASPVLAEALLALSRSTNAFPRESALRAIKRVCERGRFASPEDAGALNERLQEALQAEEESFAFSLLDEE